MIFFFFNDTATTEIYTLSLHDALPISRVSFRILCCRSCHVHAADPLEIHGFPSLARDRKSTRLNSSHLVISYAVFCLKKKNPISNRNFKSSALQHLPAKSFERKLIRST